MSRRSKLNRREHELDRPFLHSKMAEILSEDNSNFIRIFQLKYRKLLQMSAELATLAVRTGTKDQWSLDPQAQRANATDKVQIAMATLSDRDALVEGSDVLVRGGGTPPASREKRYLAEVNIPTDALREAVLAAKARTSVASPKLASVLQSLAILDKSSPTFVILDSEI
jgi:hypothetical protein